MKRELGGLRWALLVGILMGAPQLAEPLRAQTTNRLETPPAGQAEGTDQTELIRRLLQRVEELEQKVKALEAAKGNGGPTNDTKAMRQVEELDAKVKSLEQQQELDQQAQEARAKQAPRISIGRDGFYFGSANGDFAVQLKGVLQMDSRTFFADPAVPGNNELLMRRVRPVLEGTVFRDFDFLFVPDFAPSGGPQLFDAYVNYRYSPALQFQAGKFKVPVGLEQLVQDRDTLFNERALVTDLVPNRDVGFQLHGDLWDGRVSYAAGLFNGTTDDGNTGNTDYANDKAFAGRLFLQPFRKYSVTALQGIGFGVAGSYETMSTANTAGLPPTAGGTFPGYTTDGQQQFFAYRPADGALIVADNDHWRVSPQGYYYYGPFGLLGEYAISDQSVRRAGVTPFSSAHLQNTAWELSVSWVLTGEDARYAGGVIPKQRFDPANGHWGAWQLVARYAELDIDSAAFPLYSDPAASARAADAWALGVNWYLNRNVQVKTSFSHTSFRGGGGPGITAPAIVTRQDENVLFTRVQLAF
jgi:phosphate-selective porin OprO and OprP